MVFDWGWIKRAALQLMFSYSLNGVISTSRRNEDYKLAFIERVNEALIDLAGVMPYQKEYHISQHYVENMLGEKSSNFAIEQVTSHDVVKLAVSPKACYFEMDGPGSALLELVDAENPNVTYTITSWTNTTKGSFKAYRYLITDEGAIQLRFIAGAYPYNIRNIAFYAQAAPSQEEIPAFTRYNRYDLKKLIPDFLMLEPNQIVRMDYAYRQNEDYFWEGQNVLVLNRYLKGQIDIRYNAVPTQITADTPDSFVPELDPRAVAIIPLYLAGKTFMQEDSAKATVWLNEYYAKQTQLSMEEKPKGEEKFHCNSGWV